ncbi:MAG TPA: metallophosphoesterase [Polyangia bacterium]|nr:metallophosphoesterase [Polyangia bacterium]
MSNDLDKNILVISDLHLGEDLRPGGAGVSYLRHLVRLERELENFLAHYTRTRIDDRPWSLVVNGDMVDFMSVMIIPGEEADENEDAEDRRYGLGFGERQSQKKLEKVIVRHRGVFGKLAEFVAAGNELVIVMGNHDVEFHYPSVQRTLVEWLVGLAVGAGAPEEAKAEFQRRITFCPWFYYREDLIYIEHGHQYDEYCSFDYLLHPVAAEPRGGKKSRIALSVAHAGMRYFANQLPDYDPHTAEHWGFVNYAKWAWAQGLKGAIRIFYVYGLLVWRLVELWYSLIDRRNDSERRAVHRERLKELSTSWKIAEEKLVALDALRREPVTKRLYKLLSALFLDRVLLGAVGLAAASVLAAQLHGVWLRILVPFGTLLGFAALNQILGRLRLEPPSSRLRSAPELIRKLVRAPYIVFGHSHAPERIALSGGATYFNTGTWASDDEGSAFTHLMVTRGAAEANEVPLAELKQWRDGSSTKFGA